jgi:predicted nuclease of restriction endonuclease-like (RecB) superfamily
MTQGLMPAGYALALEQLKTRIRSAQFKAAVSVNHELIQLSWDIGKQIVERQRAEPWGRSVVDRLAHDLQREFPGVAGFSAQNLWKMRAFFLAYTEEVRNLSQPVREFDGQSLPEAMRGLPWGHNTELIFKVKDPHQRLWYAQQTVEHGWSRATLLHQIETGAPRPSVARNTPTQYHYPQASRRPALAKRGPSWRPPTTAAGSSATVPSCPPGWPWATSSASAPSPPDRDPPPTPASSSSSTAA